MVRMASLEGLRTAMLHRARDLPPPARLACVDLPAWPLQLLVRRHPDWRRQPAAVVDRDKAQGTLLWVNEAARQKRILPGMRYATALSPHRVPLIVF